MNRIYFCSWMLAAPSWRHKFSHECMTPPLPQRVGPPSSASTPAITPPPPPRRVDDAAAVMRWLTNAASAGMDRQPRLFKLPFDSISAYCVEDKRDGNSFPRKRENSLLFHFSQKIEVTCWIFSPGLILHQSKLQLSFGHKASDDSNEQGLFFSALECHQFLLFWSYSDLSWFTVTHSTVVSQK